MNTMVRIYTNTLTVGDSIIARSCDPDAPSIRTIARIYRTNDGQEIHALFTDGSRGYYAADGQQWKEVR